MKNLMIILVITLCLGCNSSKKNKIIKGDIYVKLIDFGSLYGAEKNIIDSITMLTMTNKYLKGEEEPAINKYYRTLINHNLLDKPYFKLKLKDNKIINVFTNENEYLKVSNYISELDRDKEKIVVEFKGYEKEEGIFYAEKIISVEKIEGKTDWAK